MVAVAALLAACGGDSSSGSTERAGEYEVRVTEASFPDRQYLGETSLLRLAVRNTGEKTVPALTVTFSIAGKEGQTSMLPFGIHDQTPGLAQPDRPAWVLAHTYPRLRDSPEPGGASSANRKTFDFGSLKPGATTEAVWKLSAVKVGRYTLLYRVNAGVTGAATAVTDTGVPAGGSFVAEITDDLPDREVTDSGEVVEIGKGKSRSGSGKR